MATKAQKAARKAAMDAAAKAAAKAPAAAVAASAVTGAAGLAASEVGAVEVTGGANLAAIESGPIAVTGGANLAVVEVLPIGNLPEAGGVPGSVSLELPRDEDEDERDFEQLLTPSVKVRVKALVAEQLKLAERDERSGPGGSGWTHNESKREEVEEWAAFLRYVSGNLVNL